MTEKGNFTEGPIIRPLLGFTLPVIAALFLQMFYGAVDMFVVGRFSDSVSVSAVSTGSQAIWTLTCVVTGVAMGMTILIGQYIGEGAPEKAGKSIGAGIVLFTAMTIVMTVIGVCLTSQICSLLKAPAEAFAETVVYVRICSFGFIFIIAFNVLGGIFRGIGDSQVPLYAVIIACVFNIAGDLLFVAVFQMGAAGAAIATAGAQAISVLISMVIIRRRKLPFEMKASYIRVDTKIFARILKLGIPVALQDLLVSFSFLFVMAIVNSRGLIASAGVGVAEKLCGFIMLIPSAFMSSMSAFVAQNYGAGKIDRAKKTLLCGLLISVVTGLGMFYLAFFQGDTLSEIFTKESDVIEASFLYLKAYGIDTFLTSFLFCFTGFFNGCGKTVFVMVQSIIGAFGVRIPIAYLLSQMPGSTLFHVGLGTPASSFLQIIFCVIYFIYLRKKKEI